MTIEFDETDADVEKAKLAERERARWHFFGINHLRDGERAYRRLWLHRAWHLYRDGEVLSVELAVPGGLAWRLELNGDEHPIAGHLGLGLFTLYWNLGWWARKLPFMRAMQRRYRYDSREISVDWNGEAGGLFWHLWADPHSWSRRDKRWHRGSFIPMDALFGRQRYQRNLLSVHKAVSVVIPGDPAAYSAIVELEHPVWTRPRWPWWPLTREKHTASIDVLKGIPIPGKGENSWDCDDDAVYGLTTPATTVEEAVAALVASVQRDRKRHGGEHWKPASPSESRGGTEA